MRLEMFIWAEKRLTTNNSLLLDNGYVLKETIYELTDERDSFTVLIACEQINDEHKENRVYDAVQTFVPKLKYLVQIIIFGDVPDEVLNSTIYYKLAAELGGVVEVPSNGSLQNGDGEVIHSYEVVNEAAALAQVTSEIQEQIAPIAPDLKKQINRNFFTLFAIFGAVAVAMLSLVIYFSVNPTRSVPAIVSSGAVLLICIGLLVFFLLQYRKVVAFCSANPAGGELNETQRVCAEATAYNYDANKRRFAFSDEKSDKFWNVNYIGSYYYVHYGKNGTQGRIEVKEAASEEACKAFVEKTISEKVGKGYVENSQRVIDDAFESVKVAFRPAYDSMYFMFHEEVPLIYIAAIKAACDQFCDVMRLAFGNTDKILSAVKALVLVLNNYVEDPGLIETEEREILSACIDTTARLAGYENPDDLAGEWREW